MDETGSGPATKDRTAVERRSERELVVTRSFEAPARLLFEAWTTPELFMRWWAPKSLGVPLLACEMDVRPGGRYRLEFGEDSSSSMAFYGEYTEVAPPTRLAWTNDEAENGALTTVTFDEKGGTTLLTYRELYRSKEALDESLAGMEGGMPEQFDQLDALLANLRAGG